jgi:hypothetical protein
MEIKPARRGRRKSVEYLEQHGGNLKKLQKKVPRNWLKPRLIEAVKALGGAKKPSLRGAIVKQVMKEQGLSLPMASKYVKEHNLYQK